MTMQNEQELSVEKSEALAYGLQVIAMNLQVLDLDYARLVAQGLRRQASKQESMSVLNPSYPLRKNDVLRKQAEALETLCSYVDLLKEVDTLKEKVGEEVAAREEINKLFL